VGLAASWLSTLLDPMAKLATVVAGAVPCRLLVAGGAAVSASAGATLGISSCPGLGASTRLTWLAALAAACRGRGLPPSFCHPGDRPRESLWFIAVDNIEATYRLFDRHHGEVQQRLDQPSDLLVLLEDATEELLDGPLLVVGVIAELHHLLLQSVETESKVINIITWLEGQVLPLLTKCLQHDLTGTVTADVCHSDDVSILLDSSFLEK
jgi:hypothetical protein